MRSEILNRTFQDPTGMADRYRRRGTSRCRLRAGVTLPGNYQPRDVVFGRRFAIPHALRAGVGGFAGVGSALGSRGRRHWLDCGSGRGPAPLVFRVGRQAEPRVSNVRVMSANIYEGMADADHLVRSARAQADVVAFQELTPRAVDRLSAAGLDATFPYRYLDARGASTGVGMWSRYPIQAPSRIDGYTMAFISAQVRVTGVSMNPTVVVAHIPGPWPYPIDDWRRDLDRLPTTLRELAERADRGAVIVAADVNSTTDMRSFRALLHDGYRDAAEQSGAGIKPTFPADTRLPPLVAIDHILTRNSTATSLHTLAIQGSDHRGLVVTVTIPPSSANP